MSTAVGFRNVIEVPSAVRTAATYTADGAVPAGASKVSVFVDVTAENGTATLDVDLLWSTDGSTWYAAQGDDDMTQITATGKVVTTFDVRGPHVRLQHVVGAATSFTYSATVVAW